MRQRVRQFVQAGRLPSAADFDLARQHLPMGLYDLFAAQHPRDVVHAANVARWLIERGHTYPDLLAAALLHDVGKGHQRRLDRVAYVLAARAGLVAPMSNAGSKIAVRRAIARSAEHCRIGAEMLAAVGAPKPVVDLTRQHHAPPAGDPVLALLQQADAAN